MCLFFVHGVGKKRTFEMTILVCSAESVMLLLFLLALGNDGGPESVVESNKALAETGDPRHNVPV